MINIPENKHVNPSLVNKEKDKKNKKIEEMFNGNPAMNLTEGKEDGAAAKGHHHKGAGAEVKAAHSVEEIIEELTPEEKRLLIGSKTDNPLHEAFPKKRVVHPGATGQFIPSGIQQETWEKYMSFTTEEGTRRAAYIHIPFCSQKCLYCGFFQNFANEELETNYVDHLIRQLETAGAYEYVKTGKVNAVFFGGGTPSVLSPYNATRLLKALHRCLPLANDCEITMESTIHDLTKEKLEAWYGNGVNRISIGVQSFDTEIRRSMGRKEAREVVIENIKRAASYNQGVIIVDLIYGFPNQTVEKFIEDLQLINDLPIDGMDLYQLNIFENSALKKAIDKGILPPAVSTKKQADYLAAAVEFLEDLDYNRLSVCHWSKNHRERSLYNTLAKSDAEVIPFGSGAGGYLRDISMFLHRDLKSYNELIEADKWPMMVMLQDPVNKPLYKELQAQVEQLRIDLNKLAAKFDERVLKLETLMKIWEDYGLIAKAHRGYRLTVAGQFWHNNLTQTMIEMLERLLAGKRSIQVQPIAAQG